MSSSIHPIARAIHDLAHVYTQCERLLERLEALMLKPVGNAELPTLGELGRPVLSALEELWLQDLVTSAQGFCFKLIPGKRGAKKPKAQLCFVIVLAPADADHPDPLSPTEPYLLTFMERNDHFFESYENCVELTPADFDGGLHGELPWLHHSADLGTKRWHEQPDGSWWAFATRLLELRDDHSLMQRVVSPTLRLLHTFTPSLAAPPGAFHFKHDGEGWRPQP